MSATMRSCLPRGPVLMVFLLIAFNLIFTTESCSTNRLYVGSLNESYPDLLSYNGIYLRQQETHDNHPVYRHESNNKYLFYMADVFYGHYWVIGPTLGGTDSIVLAVFTQAMLPDLAQENWHVNTGGQWAVLTSQFSVQCVEENFRTCSGETVKLTGLSPNRQSRYGLYMGRYQKQATILSDRPVYRQEAGHSFLYYLGHRKMWIIGTAAGGDGGLLFVMDEAWRPEYITGNWILLDTGGWAVEGGLKVSCN